MTSEDNHQDVQFLEQRLKDNPESMLFARLADHYLATNRVEKAIEMCEEGIKQHPYYATGHFVLGKGYLTKKMYEQAEKEFKRVLLFDPKFLAAHKYYGDLMREIGWENTCELSYKKILQIDPLDEVARSVVGDSTIAEDEASVQTEQPKTSATPEVDVDAISPLPVTPEEEDLMFELPEPEKAEPAAETETGAEAEAPKKEGMPPDEPKITQIDDEPELDEKKAEEFSYILDDIFKDEVIEKASKPAISKEANIVKEESSEGDHGKFLAEFGLESATASEAPAPAASPQQESAPQTQEAKPATENVAAPESNHLVDKSEPDASLKMPELVKKTSPPPKVPKRAKSKKRDRIVTPTLGEIYAAQGQYNKAIDVFETLIKKHPDNEFYAQKLEMLKAKLEEAKNEAKG